MSSLVQVLLTLTTGFFICLMAIPSIIKVATLKNLYDEPEETRKHHNSNIPTLGGIAIFAGFIFSLTFWAKQNEIIELQYIIASLIILFFMGIKDDIISLVAHKKLAGQFVAGIIVVYFGDIRLTSLYGIFEVYDIPYIASLLLSLLTVIAITNSFNLIDGIDTLAGTIGIISSICFGTWFYLAGYTQYSILAAAIAGPLFAFLIYNKTPAQIFMGDTGSLVIGLVCSILAIKFIEANKVYIGPPKYSIASVPAVAIGVLIIPIFDTARVFILRTLQGKSPLAPDRNHLHHILTDLKFNHIKATASLATLNIIIITISMILQSYIRNGELLLFINVLIIFIYSTYFSYKRRSKKKEKNEKVKDYKFTTTFCVFLFIWILSLSNQIPHLQ